MCIILYTFILYDDIIHYNILLYVFIWIYIVIYERIMCIGGVWTERSCTGDQNEEGGNSCER